jgi:acetyltransferase-like isoleucine patch superfamily enzyme
MAILTSEQINAIGFKCVGKNVFISEKASFYNPQNISIGNNIRIDDFCVLSAGSGGINIGNFVHIAVGTTLIGKGCITLSDFSNLSSRVSVYSSSDDYSGQYMTNPMIPEEYLGVNHADVLIGKHVIIGCGSVILPGVKLLDGVAVGALSLVKHSCQEFGIYAGNPAVWIKERNRNLLSLEEYFHQRYVEN